MFDELIKNLRHDSASALQNCEFDFVHDWMLKAADAIEDLEKSLSIALLEYQIANNKRLMTEEYAKQKIKWIPVTERLPEESGSYLIADGGIVMEGLYEKDWGDAPWTDPGEMYMTYHPTHWMPLPEPPESEEQNG